MIHSLFQEPVKVNTLKTADRIIKRVRRSSVRVAPAVYRSAARATLKRNKKHTEEVMKITEASKQIVSHAETEAKQLLSKKGSSLSVSRKNLHIDYLVLVRHILAFRKYSAIAPPVFVTKHLCVYASKTQGLASARKITF